MSKESGISYTSLLEWYLDMEILKEDHKKTPTPTPTPVSIISSVRDICQRCKKNPVEIQSSTKRPVSSKSVNFGLCGQCRRKNASKLKQQKEVQNGTDILGGEAV
ncbi:hypothetical protein ACFLZM_06065 [Thermodesulfobacteriota bacterium]